MHTSEELLGNFNAERKNKEKKKVLQAVWHSLDYVCSVYMHMLYIYIYIVILYIVL